MRKYLGLFAAAAAFTLLTGFGMPHGPGLGKGRGMGPEHREKMLEKKLEHFLSSIEATDRQRTRIDGLKRKWTSERREAREQHKAVRAELALQWKSDQPDPAVVNALVDQQVELFRARQQQMADLALELHSILEPQQRAQVTELFENGPRQMRRQMRAHMRGQRPGQGAGKGHCADHEE